MPKGRFIVLEGLDGSGITTQAEHLRLWCQQNGIEVLATKEPTEGPAGLLIKLALRKDLRNFPEEFLALLFAADRLFHVDRDIRPALRKGTTVISDRYVLSSLAYQSVKIKDTKWLRQINSHAPTPDVTIFLDVPARDCVRRLQSDVWRGLDKIQLYERLPILEQVRHNFLELIPMLREEGQNITIIDGTNDIEIVVKSVIDVVARAVKKRRGVDTHDSGSQQLASMLGRERLAS
jgi:dTMP kinase